LDKKEILNRIRAELVDAYGSFIYNDEQYDCFYHFLHTYYPGPEWIVWCSEDGYAMIAWDFSDPKDETFLS